MVTITLAMSLAALLGLFGLFRAGLAEAAAPVLVGAGDIASCSESGDEVTARMLDGISGTVFTLGDNAYNSGTAAEYRDCYDPTWGRHKARTRPVPGNHEYGTPGAAGYFGYFGAAAGPSGLGYYSYDLGAWHVIALNSNLPVGPGSAQHDWLLDDLAAHPSRNSCTLAMWHHPVFSSGEHGNDARMAPAWKTLDEAGAELALVAHDHDYERFAPQTSTGTPDPNGLTQIVVGTGGRYLRPFATAAPNSVVRNSNTLGLLQMTLRADGLDYKFVPQPGKTFADSGGITCDPPPAGGISPETTITSGPTGNTAMTSASFSFTSNSGAATFECSLDESAFAACASPKDYSALADGTHTFRVRAVDPEGNRDASPAGTSWTVATSAPPPAAPAPTTPTPVPPPPGCTIVGTPAGETIYGTSSQDVICGLGGNDTIRAGAGNDTVKGGLGNDRISGGPGSDRLFGEGGTDALNTLDGARANDLADGGAGRDTCTTNPGDRERSCP